MQKYKAASQPRTDLQSYSPRGANVHPPNTWFVGRAQHKSAPKRHLFTSPHVIYPAVQNTNAMCTNATYNSLGGSSTNNYCPE